METELLLSEEQTRGKVRHSRGCRSFLSWLCCLGIGVPPASCSPLGVFPQQERCAGGVPTASLGAVRVKTQTLRP